VGASSVAFAQPSASCGSALAAPEMSTASNAPAQPSASNSRPISAEELELTPRILFAYYSCLLETKTESNAKKYLSCLKQLMIKDSLCPDAMATSAYIADVSARPENKLCKGNLKVAAETFCAFWKYTKLKVWPVLPENAALYQFRSGLPKVGDAAEPEAKRARTQSSTGFTASLAPAQPSASSGSAPAPAAAEIGAAPTALAQPGASSGSASAAAVVAATSIALSQPSMSSGSASVEPEAKRARTEGSTGSAASIALAHPSASSRSAPAAAEIGAAAAPEISSGAECVICMERPATHIAVPCGHQAVCEVCSNLPLQACPCCRAPIEKTIRVFVVGQRDEAALPPAIRVVDGVHTLMAMGFSEVASRAALRNAEGDMDMAVAMICSE